MSRRVRYTQISSLFASISDQSENKDDQADGVEDDKKSPTELDKYWKAVNDDPTDFTAWTYLLQYVDQEVDENK